MPGEPISAGEGMGSDWPASMRHGLKPSRDGQWAEGDSAPLMSVAGAVQRVGEAKERRLPSPELAGGAPRRRKGHKGGRAGAEGGAVAEEDDGDREEAK